MASVITDLTTLAAQVAEWWVPVWRNELRCAEVLPALLPRESMPSAVKGDKVKVTEIADFAGTLQDKNDCTFESEAIVPIQVEVPCDKRAYSALKFCEIVEIQTSFAASNSQVRRAMRNGVIGQVNDHLYSTISCNNELASTANLTADVLTTLTKQADDLCWPQDDRWLLVDSCYKKDLLDSALLTNSDFGAADTPVIGGTFVLQRYGWNIVFDLTTPIKTHLNAGAPGVGLAYTTGFLLMAEGYQDRVKMSDAHSGCEWAFNVTIDSIFGAAVGTNGADKCVVVKTGV